jgi:hypothetical protein
MDILRQDENEPDRDRYTDEPVFDLGDVSEPTEEEGQAHDETDLERQLSPAVQQLLTLFNPAALSLSGVIVAVLAAVTPSFSVWSLMTFGPFDQGQPSKGWLLGPVIAQGAIAVLLGLSSWRLALMTRAEVPRTAGAAVLLGVMLLVAAIVVWMQTPVSQ